MDNTEKDQLRKEYRENYLNIKRKIDELRSEILILREASSNTIRKTGKYADDKTLEMNHVGDFITNLNSYYKRYTEKLDTIRKYDTELEELDSNYYKAMGENNG